MINMKLHQITENYISNKIREELQSSGYFNRPLAQMGQLYHGINGYDIASRAAGHTSYPSGIPSNYRHRIFLGLSNRPGSIRL